MSDRMAAEIMIGGKLRRKNLKKFLSVLSECGGGLDWGEPIFKPASDADLLDNLEEDRRLVLFDDEIAWGEFAYLEKHCRKIGLSYRRLSAGKYEHDPELVWWRPGMRSPRCVTSSNNTDIRKPEWYIPVSYIRKIVELMGRDAPKAHLRLKRTVNQIPDVPPLEIVP